jgi:hypothetical protein
LLKNVKRFVLTYLHKLFNIDRMKNPIENIIDFAGGTPMDAARMLKVNPQRVTNWRARGMPKGAQLTAIEKGVPQHIVRPDLFPAPQSKEGDAQ